MVFSIPKPYVGAHIGIYNPGSDPGQWGERDSPTSHVREIRFDAGDILHLGHFITTKDGHFSIGTHKEDVSHPVSLAHRFEHIVKTAR